MTAQPQADAGHAEFVTAESPDYRLLPTDVIAVRVFREPELSTDRVVVGSDGTVGLPLVGSIRAEGRTVAELSQMVEQALGRGYLTNPQVTVNVLEYTSHRVTVEGAVKRPGVFTFIPGARLSTAIALAEGPDRVAKLDQVAVFRRAQQGLTVAKFDYRAVQQGTMIDPVLVPGDRVVVGTSGLSQFWQDALRTIPVFAIFTNL